MAEHIVKCRICQQQFDTNTTEFVKLGKLRYYHKYCFDAWKNPDKGKSDQEWEDLIFDYLTRDLKVTYNFFLIKQQLSKFIDNDLTLQGIFYTVKYIYGIKKVSWSDGHGGLGLVPYMYKEAAQYWMTQRQLKGEFAKGVEEQIKERSEREVIKIKKVNKPKPVYTAANWDDLGGEE